MENFLEDVLYRYVIATLDNPTKYLVFKDDNIRFTKHISKATKTAGKITAQTIKNDFYAYTGRTDIELIILPLKISYELMREEMIEGEIIEVLS